MTLDETLSLWRSTPFLYGQSDCMLSVGDYLASRGAVDVTSLFKGRYDTEDGAIVQMAAYGGACGLVDMTGVERTTEPVRGDVVVIQLGDVQIGALHTGNGVAARLERGTVEVSTRFVQIVAAWKVP